MLLIRILCVALVLSCNLGKASNLEDDLQFFTLSILGPTPSAYVTMQPTIARGADVKRFGANRFLNNRWLKVLSSLGITVTANQPDIFLSVVSDLSEDFAYQATLQASTTTFPFSKKVITFPKSDIPTEFLIEYNAEKPTKNRGPLVTYQDRLGNGIKSLALPGWGQREMQNKVLGWGVPATEVFLLFLANNAKNDSEMAYQNAIDANTQTARDTFYNHAQASYDLNQLLLWSAAGLWLANAVESWWETELFNNRLAEGFAVSLEAGEEKWWWVMDF